MIFLLYIGNLSETKPNVGKIISIMFSRVTCNFMTIIYIIGYIGTNISLFMHRAISETALTLVPISGGIKVVTIGTYHPSSKSDLLFLLCRDQDWLLWEAEEFISTSKCKCKIAPATISTNLISVFLQIQPHYFFKFNRKSQLSEGEHEQNFTFKDFPDLWP